MFALRPRVAASVKLAAKYSHNILNTIIQIFKNKTNYCAEPAGTAIIKNLNPGCSLRYAVAKRTKV